MVIAQSYVYALRSSTVFNGAYFKERMYRMPKAAILATLMGVSSID